jgi:membrane protease YdiL (CAAX protease family)
VNGANAQANEEQDPGLSTAARTRRIASSILLCVVVAIGTDVLVALLVQLNTRFGDAFPWFIAPAVTLSLAVLTGSRRWYQPLPSVNPPSTAKSVLASVFLGMAIAVIALLFDGLHARDAVIHGRIALGGDQYSTTAAVRAGVSLTVPVMAAFYEEAGVRGALQLRLQQVLGPLWAEILAGTVFVFLHGLTIVKQPWQIPFLALSGFANGRLAAVTQTVKYSALSHGLSNGILVVTYIVLRGTNG